MIFKHRKEPGLNTIVYRNNIRFIVFLVALLSIFCLACIYAPQAFAARDYGFLSSKYESSDNPASIDYDPYTDANGSKQEQGVAYGAYQMSTGNAKKFSQWLSKSSNATYKTWGKTLVTAGKADVADENQNGVYCGTNFDKKWRSIASASSEAFFTAQYLFCIEIYYNPAVSYWKAVNKDFNPNDYGIALRATLFSTAIQHGSYGSAYYIFKNVGFVKGMTENELIKRIYEERARPETPNSKSPSGYVKISGTFAAKQYGINGKYLVHFYNCTSSAQISIYRRLWVNEKNDALNYCPHTKVTGGTVSFKHKNDKYVQKITSVKKCVACKAIVKASSVKNCAVSYTYKGKYWKDQSGAQVTVHAVGYYSITASSLCLRKTASTKSKAVTYLSKGRTVKARKVVMGSDGYYWAYLNTGGHKGYVRMTYLSHLGTSSKHKFVNGRCKYCTATKVQVANKKAGMYKTASKVTVFKAAYAESSKVTVLSKNKKVSVMKIYKNSYNDYWGKLSTGGYVKMNMLKR